jgi:hypothetical protein
MSEWEYVTWNIPPGPSEHPCLSPWQWLPTERLLLNNTHRGRALWCLRILGVPRSPVPRKKQCAETQHSRQVPCPAVPRVSVPALWLWFLLSPLSALMCTLAPGIQHSWAFHSCYLFNWVACTQPLPPPQHTHITKSLFGSIYPSKEQ